MAAYKDLVGQKITKVTSNPGEPKTGQMWYNSTAGKLRGLGNLKHGQVHHHFNCYMQEGIGSRHTNCSISRWNKLQELKWHELKNIMELDGFSGGGTLNTARSIWRMELKQQVYVLVDTYRKPIHMEQKNMMEQVGQIRWNMVSEVV